MSKINLEGKFPNEKNNETTFSVKGAEDMTIEKLVERIRSKIQQVHEKKAQELNPDSR